MQRQRTAIDRDRLEEQTRFVRTLAGSLVADPFGADDIAQETLLVAMVSPPRDVPDERRLRAWLARVARNVAHLGVRRERRRSDRERRAARDERIESPAEELAQESVQEAVALSVQELEEPYRTALVQRYWERRSTEEIAELSGTSVGAVRKQLWRARGKLRAALEARYNGDRASWLSGLAPLGLLRRSARHAARPVFGTLAPLGAAGAAVAASLAAAGLLLWAGVRVPGASAEPAVSRTHGPLGLAGPTGELLAPGAPYARRALAGGGSPEPPPRPPETADALPPAPPARREAEPVAGEEPVAPALVRGRVVDPWGRGLGGLAVATDCEPDHALATSAPDGRFEIAAEGLAGVLFARGAGMTALRGSPLDLPPDSRDEHLLVSAPAVAIAGRVVDERGAPVSGARVAVRAGLAALAGLIEPLHGTLPVPREAATGPDGAFAFPEAVTGLGIELSAAADGRVPAAMPMPSGDAQDLVLVLRSAELSVTAWRVRGRVLLPDGRPAPGALVRLGARTTESDSDGRFAFTVATLASDAALVAAKDGYLAAIESFGEQCAESAPRALRPVELRLAGPSVLVAGRVVDVDGEPLAGWIVSAAEEGGPDTAAMACTGEGEPRGFDPLQLCVVTDASGAFELDPATRAPVAITAHDPKSLLAVQAPEVRPGERGLVLALPRDARRERLAAHMATADGLALAGARLRLALPLRNAAGSWSALGPSAFTDAFGGFELAGVPRHHVRLQVVHPEVRPATLVLDSDAPDAGELLVLERAAFLRVVVAGGAGAPEAFALLDGGGQRLDFDGPDGALLAASLVGGASAVLRTGVQAATVIGLRAGVEVSRVPLALAPGALATVELSARPGAP
jgi:RNA polymerase sigma-70 factor (ECF subfamily)